MSDLARDAADAHLESVVRFLGTVENAARLFLGFDLVVLSSRTEGTPMVLLEAMAAGTPVIAASVGGIPDVVTGEEAVLVPAENPESLAGALMEARQNPGARAGRAEAARRRFDSEFNATQWVARYDGLYKEVRERRPARG